MPERNMNFLMYSQAGEGAQVLKRIELEGNNCELYIHEKAYKTVFDGLLEKTDNPSPEKDTIIIFDMSGNGAIADSWRRKGHFVYGASSFADDLEHDREFGFEMMKESGILIPEYKKFTDFKTGIDFVRESNSLLVFKPSGKMPPGLTYVAKSSEELLAYMNFVERRFGKFITSFILQEFIEGTVVSSEAFCGPDGFLEPHNHTVETKKSMNDDLGPSTGCSGNITWVCEMDGIAEKGVALAEEICKKHQFVGQIDLNAVINESGVYGLEWTPRFGYDATPAFLSLLECDFGEFFSGIAKGETRKIQASDKYAGGVKVSVPVVHPVEEDKELNIMSEEIGVPIQNYKQYEENIYFYEVCEHDGELNHSGGDGAVACVLGMGNTPEESIEGTNEILKNLVIPDKQYRTDLGKVLPKEVRKIELYA